MTGSEGASWEGPNFCLGFWKVLIIYIAEQWLILAQDQLLIGKVALYSTNVWF